MILFASTACSRNSLERATSTRLAMGTTVTIILVHEPGSDHEQAMDDAFAEIKRLSDMMNHYDETSPISRLNREGYLEDAPSELVEVIKRALEFNKLTNGAFDITVYPLLELFREKFNSGNVPEEKDIKKVLEVVGSDKIEVEGSGIRLRKKGMKLSIAGIAKGYIVDKASKVLVDHGFNNHLINAGGDMTALGLREDGKPWKVGIQDPKKEKDHLDVITLTDSSVATSGNYENYYDAEKVFHHITDPKTGMSPAKNSSASITAPTAMEADALATALMVMAPDYGISFINSLPGYEALVISRDGELIRSSGWKSLK